MSKGLKVCLLLAPLLIFGIIYWIFQSKKAAAYAAATPYEKGWMLIEDRGCRACHQADNHFRAPQLKGLIGQTVKLADGREVVADAAYVRSSIVDPALHVSLGYQPVMPSYAERISEEEIEAIITALGPEPIAR